MSPFFNSIRNKLYKIIFLIAISIITSCSVEKSSENITEDQLTKENSYSELINYENAILEDDFKNVSSLLKEFDDNQVKNKEFDFKIIKNSKVDKSVYGNNFSYSFLIESNDTIRKDSFQNLVLDKRKGESHAYVITYSITNKTLIPVKIKELGSQSLKNSNKQTCSYYILTVKTWCSENVHYGYNAACEADVHGETYSMKYDVCSGSGGYYGETNLISGPNYVNDSNGGGNTSGGSGSDPESIDGSDPFGGPILSDYLVSYKPTFRYPVDSNYASLYPKMTEYLRNKMPNVKNMPIITNAIKDITGLSTTQIQHDLEWGNGPTIIILQLDDYARTTDATTAGLFDGSNSENILYLDIDFVNRLEREEFYDQEFQDSYLFFMGVTILHEYVHYGDYLNGNNYTAPFEEGELFECQVYGENVTEGTLILRKK